ncbi:hypothetical protein AWC27_03440 [Mycobacterium szulgai]|uniref:Uncharacterized protein n=1 Tax=Mycobacterium szulgai TaxID=1787 RepID=A0A1X2EDT6_MYCSZ|nr:hypothetical protein AWC27_03440 [Mycobacterium szulgai]
MPHDLTPGSAVTGAQFTPGNQVEQGQPLDAAVLPQQARAQIRKLEFGKRKGQVAGPLERLACYAAQPDSAVDVVGSGRIADTPYLVTRDGDITLSDNFGLAYRLNAIVRSCGAVIITNPSTIRSRMGFDGRSEAMEFPPAATLAT